MSTETMSKTKLPKGINSSQWRLWFVYGAIISISFVIACSVNQHTDLKQESNRIANTYKKANEEIRQSIRVIKPDTLSSPYSINKQVIQQMEHNEQMIRDLLDLEFSRIQTERNVLEIWAAVITIVFLVFSFYSTFKTDDMVKDAQSLLSSLNQMHSQAEGEKEALQGELRGILTPYSEQAKLLAEKASRLEKDLGMLSDLPERLKKIDGLDNFIESSNKSIADIRHKIEEYDKDIQNLREDIDELSQAEPDEEENP